MNLYFKYILLIIATVSSSLLFSQEQEDSLLFIEDFEWEEPIEEIEYEFTSRCYEETLPVWIGCDTDSIGDLRKCTEAKILEFIQSNLKFPESIYSFEGKTYISFIINKEGLVENVKVEKGCHELLDAETIKVVGSLPQFKPATQRNRPVKVKYYVPVRLKVK